MGSSPFITGGKASSMNTVLVFLAVVAFAAAEPELWGVYGYGLGHYGLGYGYPYRTVGYHGLGHGISYIANSGGAIHAVGKRAAEPEPEPEADPAAWYYGGHGYGYGYGHGYYGYGYPYNTVDTMAWDTTEDTTGTVSDTDTGVKCNANFLPVIRISVSKFKRIYLTGCWN